MKTFDVICPVFNEEKSIHLFFARVQGVFATLQSRYNCRLIFIDNCSSDRTQELAAGLCAQHDRVSLIVMSRNFGYQSSVECGLTHSQADFTGIVDVDCEDPPEMFVDFLQHIEEGYDLAYGERVDRHEILPIKLMRKIYYRVTKLTADHEFILDMAEFCVMSRMVREAVCQDNNSFPFIRASIGRIGFNLKNVPYKRHPRIAGQSHYNLWGMFVFGVAGILSSGTLWLRIPIYIFPFWLMAATAMMGALVLTKNPFYYQMVMGTGLMFLVFAVTGISLYLARVYKNGLQRPNYFINYKKSIRVGKKTKPELSIAG